MDKSIIKIIKDAVITVPGVAAFANYTNEDKNDLTTSDIENAIEFTNTDDITRFKIHVILLQGVNIKDITKEIQIRVKYELEKYQKNTPNLLQALKDVGVVDSGAYGLVKFLEGINSVIQNDEVIEKTDELEVNEGGNIEMELEGEFGYCTEAVVMLTSE
ncbi:hypothetical protein FQA39_LY12940 [Lamprigera yunnana]|nr:hypothetical protein FQA39_LY12940 [Lamprigera yunnana]